MAVKRKRDLSVQARLKTEKESLFCFNNSQSYRKSASAWKRNRVSPKVFWVTFLQKRDGTRFLRQLIPQFGLEASNLLGGNSLQGFARGVAGDGVAHNLLWAYAL